MVKHTQLIRRQFADELFECLKILWDFSMSDRLKFYFKQHKRLLKSLFESFFTGSIIKVTCKINISNSGLHLKVFTLLTVYIFLCFTNKFFVDVA